MGAAAISEPEEDAEFNPLTALLMGGAALGVGAAARKPGMLMKGAKGLMNLRAQLMLTGMAVPKAILGNTGGAAIKSIERKSMAPLKELFSRQTLRDIASEYKAGAPSHVQAQGTASGKALHGPGRVLGSLDTATQNAMVRAGMTAEEAAEMTFQTPLGKSIGPGIGEALDSPTARYAIPFRRTPFNVFKQGLMTVKPENLQTRTAQALLGGSLGAGAVHGAATSDEQFPMSLGLGAAAVNKYALPYLAAAAVGRSLVGGRDPEAVGAEALPISEYGITSGFTDPLKTFTDPAALRALRRIIGE
jgi:hypothetical protein